MNVLAITAILTIGLIATIVGSVASISDLIYSQYNDRIIEARLEQAAAAIQANSVVMNGVRYIPAADDTGTYATIPAWVMPNARTPTGQAFHYCPFATRDLDSIMPGNTITTTNNKPSGTAYPASTISIFNHAYTRAHNYVYARTKIAFGGAGASLAPSDVLAVIVAPTSKNTVTADCPGNIDANGFISITDHYVRVVTNPQPVQQQLAARNDTAVFYVAPNATGDASGIDPNNRATIDGVFAQLHALKPLRAHLYLTTGNYTWNNSNNASAGHSYPKGNFRQIEYYLDGSDMFNTSITATHDIDLPVNWQLQNLSLIIDPSHRFTVPPMNTVIAGNFVFYFDLYLAGGEMKVYTPNQSYISGKIKVTDGGRLMISAGRMTSVVNIGDVEISGGGRINVLSTAVWELLSNSTSAPVNGYQRAALHLRTGGRFTNQGLMINRPNIYTFNSNGVPYAATNHIYSAIDSDIGSQLIFSGSAYNFSGSVGTTTYFLSPQNHSIYLNGEMHVSRGYGFENNENGGAAQQPYTAVIYLLNGGELTIHDNVGISNNRSNTDYLYAVLDKSGNSVFGGDFGYDNTQHVQLIVKNNNSRCWDGDPSIKSPNPVYPHLFYDSLAGTDNNHSLPQDSSNLEYLRLQNISNWECHQN